jgi:two-component system, chemotaxis family, chemotaxis protein CheY
MPAILVVDDSKVMRDMIVACLRAIPDTHFVHASSGLEAIERLSLSSFDLMVLDLNIKPFTPDSIIAEVRAILPEGAESVA